MKYRVFSVLLTLVIFVGLELPVFAATSAPAVQAAEEYNKNTNDKKLELEKKYGISISYPMLSNGYTGIGTATLANLDLCLSRVTPAVISQLSSFFKETKGRGLKFEYTYMPSTLRESNMAVLASFTPETAEIEIYIPRADSKDPFTGNGPNAIVHEVGHAFEYYLHSRYGYNKLKNDWAVFNGGYNYSAYNFVKNPSITTFYSAYAAVEFSEDFADTFACAFISDRAGLGVSNRLSDKSGSTGLGRKIDYISKMMTTYMKNTATATTNIKQIYSAAPRISYKGLSLSGDALEYMGYYEPYGIINGVVSQLKIKVASKEWDRSIGGWLITDASGTDLLIFPSGSVVDISGRRAA